MANECNMYVPVCTIIHSTRTVVQYVFIDATKCSMFFVRCPLIHAAASGIVAKEFSRVHFCSVGYGGARNQVQGWRGQNKHRFKCTLLCTLDFASKCACVPESCISFCFVLYYTYHHCGTRNTTGVIGEER